MAEITRLKLVVDDLKDDFDLRNDYVGQDKIISDMRLILSIFRHAYPKEIHQEFENQTKCTLSDWDDMLDRPSVNEDSIGIAMMTREATSRFGNAIAFFVTLFLRNVNPNSEVNELEYQLDQLTTKLSLGQITEETYKIASNRINERILRLKTLHK